MILSKLLKRKHKIGGALRHLSIKGLNYER
jgi:hypothetical protein